MSRRLFNYILSLFGINAQDEDDEDEQQQQQHDSFPTETYNPEEDLILITQKQNKSKTKKNKQKNNDPLLLNPKSKSVVKKKNKKRSSITTTIPSWLSVDYLLSMIREQKTQQDYNSILEHQIEQPVDLTSEEDDGTIISEFKSLRNQVTRVSHALDTQRPSEQFANTTNLIMPLFYEKLNFITTSNYNNHWYTLYAYIMLGVASLNTKGEVKRQVFSESDWSRTLVLAMSSLLKNFDHTTRGGEGEIDDGVDKEEVEEQDELERRDVLLVLLDQLDWFSLLKQMCGEFERLDPNWRFKREYVDVVEMAAQLKEYVNK